MNAIDNSHGTICNYLFGKEAEEIFTNVKISNVEDKRKFIDQCLDVCMRVNRYILSHKEGLFVIDPRAFNNQCHLYSLRAAKIMRSYPMITKEEKRFLHLSFFLSMPLMGNMALFKEAIDAALQGQGCKEKKFYDAFIDKSISFNKKNIQEFLQDDGDRRLKAARFQFNQDFENQLKETLASMKHLTPLHAELESLAHENLRIGNGDLYYTYPKLAGVILLIDAMAREKMGFAIKAKVITQEGFGGTLTACTQNVQENEPIIILEGIATDGSMSLEACRKEAEKCPSYFRNDPREIKNHTSCFFCEKKEQDLTPFVHRLSEAIQSPETMLLALGADFIINQQQKFRHFFEDKKKYPLLSQIFQEALGNIERLGLSSNAPLTFGPCHAHPDLGKHALTSSMELDTAPKTYLKERKVI